MEKLQKCLLYFVAAFVVVHAIDPIVTITETDPPEREEGTLIVAERDRDVTMSCYVEHLQVGSMVKWEKAYFTDNGNIDRVEISSDEAVEDNISYGVEKPTLFTWRLRIRTVSIPDEGNYTCYVNVAQQIKVYATRTLIVHVRPSIIPSETSYDQTAEEGDVLELKCNATGIPPPYIQWERQGNALLPVGSEKFMGSKMLISSIRPTHRGLYKCKAFNDIGTTTWDIYLGVRFAPMITVIEADLRQKEGCTIELQCIIEAFPEPTEDELTWFQGNNRISQSTDRYRVQILRGAFNRLTYELIIEGVKSSDYGDYQCQARNTIGLTTATIELSKSGSPQKSLKFGREICGCSSVSVCLPVMFITLLLAFFTNQHL